MPQKKDPPVPTATEPARPSTPAPTPGALDVLSSPGTLTLALTGAAMALSAAFGYLLAVWLEPRDPAVVALAAALAVLCTGLPVAAVVASLGRGSVAPVPVPAPPPAALQPTPGVHGVLLDAEQFADLVGREWARARRYGTGAALLVVEIDRYERLTDALGLPAGEQVLAQLMGATALTLRGADALARRQAGQMAIFLAHADPTGALDVAERIRERAEQMEVSLPPRRVRFTVSVGVAHLRPAHLHQQALLDDVADAVAAARHVGGNCVRAAPVELGAPPAPGTPRDGQRADKR